MFKIYNQRVVERMTYARSLLKNGFDFTVQEDYPLSREDAPWAKTEEQANELWRKRVKSDWLRLKLADQDEAKIRDTLDKRYKNILDRVESHGRDQASSSSAGSARFNSR